MADRKPRTRERIVPEEAVPGFVLPDLSRWIVEKSRIISSDESPFSANLVEGDPRVVLIVGENASGKSLAFRLLAQIAGNHGIHAVTLSIRERTGVGDMGMEHFRRAVIYGEEQENSTGATSASVVQAGFRNMESDRACMLGLDEPEIGLSDGYAEALGQLIGTSAAAVGPTCCGVALVTHSRHLASGLVAGLSAAPTMIDMSSKHTSVDSWIASDERRTVEELLALPELGRKRWGDVHSMLRG